jgi:hypothetical protein
MVRSLFFLLATLIACSPVYAQVEADGSANVEAIVVAFLVLAAMVMGLSIYRRPTRRNMNTESVFLESRLSPDSFFGTPDTTDKTMQHGTYHEVDPIAEADVYLAYGRDVQAEAILNEGLAEETDPIRQGKYLLKLLELYKKRKDRNNTKATFSRINELTRGIGPVYDDALILAKELIPNIESVSVSTAADNQHAVEAETPHQATLPEVATTDEHAKSLIKHLDALTEGWTTGEKVITVQTLNSRGNLVTSTITITTK